RTVPPRAGPPGWIRHLPRRDRGLARPPAARHSLGPTAAEAPRTRGTRRRNRFRVGPLTALRDLTMAPSRRLRLAALVSALAPVLLAITAGLAAPSSSEAPSGESSSPAAVGLGKYFDYVVLLVTGNKDLCDILTTCGGRAPYLTG